ncbi:nitroreductase family protein [Neisseria perflava]|uniref:nitroreductase family protein n=1 Tax=Neisseria perflava TaxID=33053 RepID=UPI00209F842C|nr:nitroreductase family protein [Neisseria perflava]MCP1660986.1 nitroreductase/dihydropteridine reductase [Neisseria perflava]MCP1772995.1 nitroreductase/dihydropteridine reductase [Neisseria perflava]
MNNALTVAQTRYTAKAYDPTKKIPAATLDTLLEILRLSPSSTNVQAWHFFVTDKEETKAAIAESMQGSDDYNIPKVLNASHVVVLCTLDDVTNAHLDKVSAAEVAAGRESNDSGRRAYVNQYRAAGKIPLWTECQTHIALGQLLWAAALEGIDSTTIGGFQADILDKTFDLYSKGMHSSVIVTLGYHADSDRNATAPKGRLKAEDVFTRI